MNSRANPDKSGRSASLREVPHDSKTSLESSGLSSEGNKKPVKSILSPPEEKITASSDNNSDKGGENADEYAFTSPEGVELPDEVIKNFKEQAKSLKLSQADAQKFVDMGVKALTDNQKRSATQWEKRVESETRSLEADPVLGGKNYQETRAIAARAYNEIRSTLPPQTQKSLDALMIDGRLSNFRPVAEFLHAIGRRFFSEDSPVTDHSGHGSRPQIEGFNYDAVKSVFGKK